MVPTNVCLDVTAAQRACAPGKELASVWMATHRPSQPGLESGQLSTLLIEKLVHKQPVRVRHANN